MGSLDVVVSDLFSGLWFMILVWMLILELEGKERESERALLGVSFACALLSNLRFFFPAILIVILILC